MYSMCLVIFNQKYGKPVYLMQRREGFVNFESCFVK
jgi:hypothetical protein